MEEDKLEYPFGAAAAWLMHFLSAYPKAQALVCRAIAVTPEVLQEAGQRPNRLSRVQWEILRKATRGSADWSIQNNGKDLAGHLDALKAAMRTQHNRAPQALVELRLVNMQRLTAPRGAVVKMAELLGVTYQGISQLNSEHNSMGTHKARQLEGALGLPVGWFDHEDMEIPAATLEMLTASSSPVPLAQVAVGYRQPTAGEPTALSSALHQAVLEKFVALSRTRPLATNRPTSCSGS